MKISAVIDRLEALRNVHGDTLVRVGNTHTPISDIKTRIVKRYTATQCDETVEVEIVPHEKGPR